MHAEAVGWCECEGLDDVVQVAVGARDWWCSLAAA